MKRGVVAVFPLLAFMAGCHAGLYGSWALPGPQAQKILASEGKHDSRIGNVGPALEPIASRSNAKSALSKTELVFVGTNTGSLCLAQILDDPSYTDYPSVAAAAQSRIDLVLKQRWTFELRASFDDLAGKDWVLKPLPQSQVTNANISDYKVVPHSPRGSSGLGLHSLATVVNFCGAIPTVTPEMHFLVATYYPDGVGAPEMFIWRMGWPHKARPNAP